VNGSRTPRPSGPRTFFPLLILIATVVALLVAVAPALAYDEWVHTTGMDKSTCDSSGCHLEPPQPSSNTACLASGCHKKFTTSDGEKCWQCHTPGQTTAAWRTASGCTTSCHAPTVHLGASGYGKTCTACHGVSVSTSDPGGSPHHNAAAGHQPTCAECHNGALAKLPPGHEAYGTQCASCHTGMNRPSGDCATCHAKAQGSWPPVVYTNDLACGDAGCHGKVKNHSGTPITAAPCTTCHAAHYEALGTCTKCHTAPPRFHHGTATATPLVDCAGCHDGKIASAKQAHAGLACTSCHGGMGRPPVPATCHNCHDAQRFGAVACTTCHSTTGLIGKETVHATDPAATVACTTCHQAHYKDLGACTTCHGSHAGTHHGTATLADTQLKLAVTPANINARKKATLKGSLRVGGKALASQSVLIQARTLTGGSFKKVATVKTGAGGRFSRVVKPRVGTEYRAVWRPAGAYVVRQRPAVTTVRLRVRK